MERIGKVMMQINVLLMKNTVASTTLVFIFLDLCARNANITPVPSHGLMPITINYVWYFNPNSSSVSASGNHLTYNDSITLSDSRLDARPADTATTRI